jgi:HAD superfamily hydrolase (TIGR01509 family)
MTDVLDKSIELIIFDCDGVLIDSEIISARILIDLLSGLGIEVDIDYVRENFLGRSFPKVAMEIRENFGQELTADFEETYRSRLASAFMTGLRPVSGVEQVLSSLAVGCCVATSSSPKRVAMSLDISGLAGFFGDRVFTASQVSRGKPAPDLFLFVADQMKSDPARCLVIEDSMPGIQAALAAGMQVWRFVGASHLSGGNFGKAPVPPGVRVFDNWPKFFEMAPDLAKRQEPSG